MNRVILTILTLALAAGASARTLEIHEGAFELTLAEVLMPRTESGTTFVRTCVSCPTVGLRVDEHTRYTIAGRRYSLREFREAIDDIRSHDGGNSSTFVGVFYDLKTTRVSGIDVFPQPN